MKSRILCILLSLLTLAVPVTVRAQYYSVNIDTKTVAAMVAAYGTESAAEAFYNEQVKEILKHYTAAEVAAAGIFSSKYLDRKALTDLGIWSNSTENYYYRRIYNMVSAKIMPKIWTVAGMMLKSPQNALYWGTYLMKVCDETKSLCMQFESVVTNSTLSFQDIAFLQINQQIADILRLSELGGVDFRSLLDGFSQIGSSMTAENLRSDIDNLYKRGGSLAAAGVSNMAGQLLQTSNFNDLFQGKIGAAITIADNYSTLFQSMEDGIGPAMMQLLGGEDALANLFDLSNYNLTSWIDDYAREGLGQYYRQRWYIYRRDSGSETVCLYEPSETKDAVLDGPEWIRFNTTSTDFYPSTSQLEQVRLNSESHAGFSRKIVTELNRQNSDYTYDISFYLRSYIIKKGDKVTKKAYAYAITGIKRWDISETVYEEVFDSYSMDLATFQAQLGARLASLNDNEDGITYTIGSDSKNYYQTSDARKLEGIETVTISVTCNDGAVLGEGNTQYKCGTCGSSLSSHTKECSMLTSVVENQTGTSELDAMASDLQTQIDDLSRQISILEAENERIMRAISTASIEVAAGLRAEYNAYKDKIAELKAELRSLEQQLDDVNQAIRETGEGEDVPTDDYFRIPAIMQALKASYNLTWQDAGTWNGYTFIRHASIPNIKGTVTFSATISIARKPKYFLGIKIHRAIVQISWKLTAEYSSTNVVDVLTLDPDMDPAKKAELVNNRISEIARTYPSCTVNTEYARTEPVQEDDTTDTYHLLWSSDRLEIAREIDTRLTKIYSDLVSLEKMMSYKRSIIDVLKDIAPYINENQGRHRTTLEECHDRWMRNARGEKDEDQP